MEKKNVEKLQSYNRRKTNKKASNPKVNTNGIPDVDGDVDDEGDKSLTLNGEGLQNGSVCVCRNVDGNNVTHRERFENRKVCGKRSGCGRDLKTGMNGVDARLNSSEYSRTVCDVYRHENDLIFGRTRGGVVNNGRAIREACMNDEQDASLTVDTNNCHFSENAENEPLLCVCFDQENDDTSSEGKQNTECNSYNCLSENINVIDVSESQMNGILAPLASPESLSDEEDGVNNETDKQSQKSCSYLDEQFDSGPSSPQSTHDESDTQDEGVNDCVPTDSSDCNEFILETENNEEVHCTSNGALNNDESADSDIDCLMENGDLEEENEVENLFVEMVATDIDNNDDIGDFIEADLPPNVERLVFFSRDSSDEDEGCGDEVLPNNDEDIISDNETIDPTDGGYTSPRIGRRSSNSEQAQSNCGMSNALSGNVSGIRGEMCNIHPCNISCDKSTEDNNADYGNLSECRCSDECRIVDCSSCNSLSNHDNSVMNTNGSNSASVTGKYSCARCDRAMHIDSERQRELGVNICDKCFAELQVDQSHSLDGSARHRSQLGSNSGTNYLNRNCRNALMPLNNNYDKVSNNSLSMVRFSSSDSDPYDRIYVSDSSELFSPDIEPSGESLFQTSMTSDRTVMQSGEFSESRSRQEGRPLHRQSMSLDYSSPSELFSIEYNTRRSRSLDQQMLRCIDHSCTEDSSLGFEEPNIAISSSNLQGNDDNNTQHGTLDKQTYNVPLSKPSCSSSDEEENIRMPGVNSLDYNTESFDRSDLAANLEVHNDALYGGCSKDKLSRGQKMRLDDEPIYEDIEQLELLLESSERECENTSIVQPLGTSVAKLRRKRRTRSPVTDVEKVMIWNEYEAYVVQVKQIGTSACGPTAVLNVLKAFDFQVDKEEVTSTIRSNLRMEAAPIPYYLFSRYNAGTTAQDLVDGVAVVTRGAIKGRFFHFYPPREVELLKWLGHWMKKGAVPVATLNLQRGVKPGWTIPDVWHHQMVYGVSCKGIYLTNPLEIVPESVILEQLTSDSVLLVRRQDVVGRFCDWCPLNKIIEQRDLRWRSMNVLGQIVHVLREQSMYPEQMMNMKGQFTSHIKIPAAYKAGIILFMRANSDSIDEFMSAPELPLKPESQNT